MSPFAIRILLTVQIAAAVSPAFGQPAETMPEPVVLTTEEAHARMLGLLGIDSLRTGPSANPEDPNAANADESIATPYATLPDPLIFNNGDPVSTPEQWWSTRRAEIVESFDREIYGRVPENMPNIHWEVVKTERQVNGKIPVLVKTLVGRVDNSNYPLIDVEIDLTVVTPSEAEMPVPVMIHFGWNWPPGFRARFPLPDGPTWQQQLLNAGWGYATLIPTSYQSDSGAGLTEGIIGLTNRGQPRKPDDWGTLRAWAWGASRAIDYLETDDEVDAGQLGIEGLSRYGNAALVAMAYEPRLAIGFIASSGAGGAKILRRVFGEQVENLASAGEFHWFAGNFLKYAGPLTPENLLVDAHELVALCAPRPVFISVGSPRAEGTWVDAKGMFLGGVHAGPVYELLGARGLVTSDMPPIEHGLLDGDIAFRQHAGGHTAYPNWPSFLDWAGRYVQSDFRPAAWVGTWATSVQLTEPHNLPPDPGLAGNTVRQIVRVSRGGELLRARFANTFGVKPVVLRKAHLAASGGDGAIDPATDTPLTFGGDPNVTIPVGATVASDPIARELPHLADVAITIRFGETDADTVTGHPGSRTTSFITTGDAVSQRQMTGASRTDHWYIIEGIDVVDEDAAAVVTLGNSITDGRGSGTNKQNRWPDELARRLHAADSTRHVSVLNAGIGGNCVLRACLGPSALDRFRRDVLDQNGVKWLIILEGVNDIGTSNPDSSSNVAYDLIEAYREMIRMAHARDILVYGATILPFGASFYDSPEHEAARRAVNLWIRQGGAFDAVIDLDAALRDPSNPNQMHPDLHDGDFLHPSELGHRRMAEAVDLSLFTD